MRAYQLPKGGAGIDALVKVERPKPKPTYRQVLVKVTACSLNFRDLGIVRGTYRLPVSENVIPLSDGAGEVIEVGEGVRRVKVGDQVAGTFFRRWHAGEPGPDTHLSALGGGIDGMLAEYVVLEEEGVVKIPAHLSVEEGATLTSGAVIASERGGPMRPIAIVCWFARAYRAIGLTGCSSHSGRRTFITRAARLVHRTGGSLRDVQVLAGHRSLLTTQAYIDVDTDSQRQLVALI